MCTFYLCSNVNGYLVNLSTELRWNFYQIKILSIYFRSMIDTQLDGMGFMDFSRSQHGSGMSKTAQVKKMVNLLQRRAEQKNCPLFQVQEMKQIARVSTEHRIGFIVTGHFEYLPSHTFAHRNFKYCQSRPQFSSTAHITIRSSFMSTHTHKVNCVTENLYFSYCYRNCERIWTYFSSIFRMVA